MESSHRIVESDGALIVYNHEDTTAVLSDRIRHKEFSDLDSQLVAVVADYKTLRWSHQAMMLRLQGAQIYEILGSVVFLVRAEHRSVWHPQPGADNVRIVVPSLNPKGLGAADVLRLVMGVSF